MSLLVCALRFSGSVIIEVAFTFKDGQISIVPAFGASQGLEGQKGVEGARDEQNEAENDLFPDFSCVPVRGHL